MCVLDCVRACGAPPGVGAMKFQWCPGKLFKEIVRFALYEIFFLFVLSGTIIAQLPPLLLGKNSIIEANDSSCSNQCVHV